MKKRGKEGKREGRESSGSFSPSKRLCRIEEHQTNLNFAVHALADFFVNAFIHTDPNIWNIVTAARTRCRWKMGFVVGWYFWGRTSA